MFPGDLLPHILGGPWDAAAVSDKPCFMLSGGPASPHTLERWEQIIFFRKKEMLDEVEENNFL